MWALTLAVGATRKALAPWEPVSSLNIKWKFCHLSCGVIRMWNGSIVADMTVFGL